MYNETRVAQELSNYQVTIAPQTSAGVSFTPDDVRWSLYTAAGAVVNSRQSVTETPATEIVIVLSGDDLAIFDADRSLAREVWRIVIEGSYESVPFRDEMSFMVEKLTETTPDA